MSHDRKKEFNGLTTERNVKIAVRYKQSSSALRTVGGVDNDSRDEVCKHSISNKCNVEVKTTENHQDRSHRQSERQKNVSGDLTKCRLSEPTYPTPRYKKEI